jgi:replicative DNA helicase
MSVTQLCERIISSNTDTDSQRLRTGKIQDHEWELITKASSRYSFDNFLIDKSSRNPQHIRTKLRKHKPDLLIIDYLQLLQSSSKENTREREVATITRDLKLMSLEFGIPIIILSQLNRNAEGNRPSMADLRESGAIEQDSDNIIFIHEPLEVERTKLINEGKFTRDFFDKVKAEGNRFSQLIIEKQRNGPVGTLEVLKVPKLMKFIDVGK